MPRAALGCCGLSPRIKKSIEIIGRNHGQNDRVPSSPRNHQSMPLHSSMPTGATGATGGNWKTTHGPSCEPTICRHSTFSSRIRAQLSYKSTGTRLHETSRDFTRLHETSRDFTRLHETSRDFTRLHETSRDFTRLHETSRDFTRLHETSRDFTRLHETSRDFTRLHETSRDFTRLHETSRDFTRLHETSRDFTRLHETSRDFTRLHETSRDFTRLHETSRDFTRLHETSRDMLKKLRMLKMLILLVDREKVWKNPPTFDVELSSRHLWKCGKIASRMSSSHAKNSKMFAIFWYLNPTWILNSQSESEKFMKFLWTMTDSPCKSWTSFTVSSSIFSSFRLTSVHNMDAGEKKPHWISFSRATIARLVASAFKRQKRPKTSKPFQTHMLSGSRSRSNVSGSYDKEAKPSNASNVSTTWENLPKHTVQNNISDWVKIRYPNNWMVNTKLD